MIRSRNLDRPVLVGWSYDEFIIADYVRRYGDAGIGGAVFVNAITNNGSEEAASGGGAGSGVDNDVRTFADASWTVVVLSNDDRPRRIHSLRRWCGC